MTHLITLIPGDGIGKEVIPAGLKVRHGACGKIAAPKPGQIQ